jgi:hypothetical protein
VQELWLSGAPMTRPVTPWTLAAPTDEDWETQNLALLTSAYTAFTELLTSNTDPIWTESNA